MAPNANRPRKPRRHNSVNGNTTAAAKVKYRVKLSLGGEARICEAVGVSKAREVLGRGTGRTRIRPWQELVSRSTTRKLYLSHVYNRFDHEPSLRSDYDHPRLWPVLRETEAQLCVST